MFGPSSSSIQASHTYDKSKCHLRKNGSSQLCTLIGCKQFTFQGFWLPLICILPDWRWWSPRPYCHTFSPPEKVVWSINENTNTPMKSWIEGDGDSNTMQDIFALPTLHKSDDIWGPFESWIWDDILGSLIEHDTWFHSLSSVLRKKFSVPIQLVQWVLVEQ